MNVCVGPWHSRVGGSVMLVASMVGVLLFDTSVGATPTELEPDRGRSSRVRLRPVGELRLSAEFVEAVRKNDQADELMFNHTSFVDDTAGLVLTGRVSEQTLVLGRKPTTSRRNSLAGLTKNAETAERSAGVPVEHSHSGNSDELYSLGCWASGRVAGIATAASFAVVFYAFCAA